MYTKFKPFMNKTFFMIYLVVLGPVFFKNAEGGGSEVVPVDSLVCDIIFGGPEELYEPWGLAYGKYGIYVADKFNNRVVRYKEDGELDIVIGSIGAKEGELYIPMDVEACSNGNIVVADSSNERIQVFDENGNFVSKFELGYMPRTIGVLENQIYVDCVNCDECGDLVMPLSSGIEEMVGVGKKIPSPVEGHSYRALNRVKFGFFPSGEIVVGRQMIPIVERIYKTGETKWSIVFTGTEVEQNRKWYLRNKYRGPLSSDLSKIALVNLFVADVVDHSQGDGRGVFQIMDLDTWNGNTYVLIAGVIFEISEVGQIKRKFRPLDMNGQQANIHSFCISENGDIFAMDNMHEYFIYKYDRALFR